MRYATKASPLAIKSVGDGGLFEGYASIFGNVDAGQDVVIKGAYLASLRERGPRAVKMLREHDPARPIGTWLELREDDTGLFCRGQLLLSIDEGRETYELLKSGAVDGLSIGYQAVRHQRDTAAGTRILEEIDLREISVVTFAMNEAATVTSVKKHPITERELERLLTQDAGFTRSEARLIINGGFKSLSKAMQDAGGDRALECEQQPDPELARMLRDLNQALAER